MSASSSNSFAAFSSAMADAIENASSYTVTVAARRRIPTTGVLFRADLVLTADHGVERDEDIRVYLPDGSPAAAKIAGRDPGSDLAVLRLENSAGVTASAGTEGRVGQIVLAAGRPEPEGMQASLGVISAVGGPVRTGRGGILQRYYRLDATPYPGFSGGPLLDAEGKLLGLNTSGLSSGAFISIPVQQAFEIAAVLAEHGHIRRGYLGIRSQPVTISAAGQKSLDRAQERGLLLVSVEEGAPAEKGGLMVGDLLVAVAGQPVTDPDELLLVLSGDLVGKPAVVQVLRGGEIAELTITVGEK